jgi:uncharacterized damage-inducible protein DinB
MHPSLEPLRETLALNSKLFRHCLEGMSDEDTWRRPDGRANNIAFIGLHICDARFHLASWLGLDIENPFGRFSQVKHIDDMPDFPGVAELTGHWDRVSAALEAHVPTVGEDVLKQPAPFELPVGDGKLLSCLAFMLQHEAYHIGQLSLLRKQLGFDAMKWF